MIRQLGLGVVWSLLLGLASAPLWLNMPAPDTGAVNQVMRLEEGAWRPVSLPQARRPSGGWEHYRLILQGDEKTASHLFIPAVSQRAVVELAGKEIADTQHRTTMMGMASGVTALVPFPPGPPEPGDNVIDIHVQSLSLVPAYLSSVYVGSADELSLYYRAQVFLLEYLRLMVPAGQILITLVVAVLWLYRPREALFGWLFLLLVTSMYIYLGMMRDLVPSLLTVMPYLHMLGSAASAIQVIIVLLIAGIPPPRWLKLAAVLVPAACIVLGLSGVFPAPQLVKLVNAPFNILGLLVSLGIAVHAALIKHLSEAWLLLLPLLLAVLAALHDYAVITARLDGPVLLSVYYRPALMIGIAMILMRRLGVSLNRLDGANAYLTQRLDEQERELQRLHQEERREAARRTLSEERRRLTADLHDGLSGHLASIIALSEREKSGLAERAAREALEDLRLVIHSLDIEDRELPVALAGLRERLERQLKRLGVRLEWSMARLPEIQGVTPSQALNVLRILQEAVTNAIKHGEASCIRVKGDEGDDGTARIQVENDGRPLPLHPNRSGSGLQNMRRRIRELGGVIEIAPLDQGTRLTMLLPTHLPGASAPP